MIIGPLTLWSTATRAFPGELFSGGWGGGALPRAYMREGMRTSRLLFTREPVEEMFKRHWEAASTLEWHKGFRLLKPPLLCNLPRSPAGDCSCITPEYAPFFPRPFVSPPLCRLLSLHSARLIRLGFLLEQGYFLICCSKLQLYTCTLRGN